MTNEPALKSKNGARNVIKVILRQNVCPNDQLCNGKGGGHYILFPAILCPLHSITNKEQYEKHLCSQSSHYRKYRQHSHREATSHYHKSTPCVVSKKSWNTKEDNDTCIVCTVVGEKAHVGTKRHRTVKK